MLHKLTSKLVFACQNSHWFPHFFGFPVSQACLLWVGVIFSDNRSTRLLPKPFWVVEMHHTAKIIWHFVLRLLYTIMIESWSQASNQCLKKVVYQKAFGQMGENVFWAKSQLSQGREIWRYWVKESMPICLSTTHWKVLEYFLPNISSQNALLQRW